MIRPITQLSGLLETTVTVHDKMPRKIRSSSPEPRPPTQKVSEVSNPGSADVLNDTPISKNAPKTLINKIMKVHTEKAVSGNLENTRLGILDAIDGVFPTGNDLYRDQGRKLEQVEESDETETINISQLKTDSTLKIATLINNSVCLNAVVDTAAQVTILSDKIYCGLDPKPGVKKHVVLQTAGRQLKITGHVVGPLAIKLGKGVYTEDVIVAPIQDDMLLGLDFMLKHDVSINLPRAHVLLGGEEIPMVINQSTEPSHVSRVCVEKRTVIPPNSVKLVPCKSDINSQFLLEPIEDTRAVIPRTLHSGKGQLHICALNPSDRYILLKKGDYMGNAHEVTLATPANEGWTRVRQITENPEDKESTAEPAVPNQLQEVLTKAKGNLTPDQFQQVEGLLREYQDVHKMITT